MEVLCTILLGTQVPGKTGMECLLSEALVNVRGNYNRVKVAQFLSG